MKKKRILCLLLVLVLCLGLFPVSASAAVEGPGSRAEPIEIDVNTTVKLTWENTQNNSDNLQCYIFTLNEPSRIRITGDYNLPSDGAMQLQLTLGAFHPEHKMWELGRFEAVTSVAKQLGSGPNQLCHLRLLPGTYYLISSKPNEDETFSFFVEAISEANIYAEREPLQQGWQPYMNQTLLDTRYVGNHEHKGDTDVYVFSLSQPRYVSVTYEFTGKRAPYQTISLMECTEPGPGPFMHSQYVDIKYWDLLEPMTGKFTSPKIRLEPGNYAVQVGQFHDRTGNSFKNPYEIDDYYLTINTGSGGEDDPAEKNSIIYTCYKDANGVSYAHPNQSWVNLQNDGTFEMQIIRNQSSKRARGTWENIGPTDKPEYAALKVLPDMPGFDQEYTFKYNSDGNLVSDKGNLGDVPKGSIFSVLDSAQPDSSDSISPPPSNPSFYDVPRDAWYAQNVQVVAEMGLFSGKGDGRFAPNDNVTIAETIKLAAGLHAELTYGDYTFRQGTPWYKVYENYLNEAGDFPAMWMHDYNSPATRDQFARMMEGVLSLLPDDEQNKNTVTDGAIPDVPNAADNSDIYGLYRTGILIGSDNRGNFRPNSTILRSEVAAIMHRFIDPAQRKSITLSDSDSGTAGNTTNGGDQTGFVPPSWSWEREGTEGYDRSVWTAGKYVREDGKAVIYIESSDSWDFFSYLLHTMADGGKSAFTSKDWTYGGTFVTANTDGSVANDPSNGMRMTWKGDGELTVDIDWIDATEDMYASPVGVYHLVREK